MGLFSISLTVAHSTSKRSKYGSKWAIIGILIFTGISPLAATSEEVEPAISDDVGENEPSTVNSVHDGGSVCAVPRVSLLSILLNGSSSDIDGRRDDVSEVSSCSARPKCDEVSGCTAPLHCFDFRQLTDTNASVIPDPPHVVIVTPHQLESIVENSSVQNICAVVLFYAPWCTFSVQFAKKFNALGRSFDSMPFLAVNLAENEPYAHCACLYNQCSDIRTQFCRSVMKLALYHLFDFVQVQVHLGLLTTGGFLLQRKDSIQV